MIPMMFYKLPIYLHYLPYPNFILDLVIIIILFNLLYYNIVYYNKITNNKSINFEDSKLIKVPTPPKPPKKNWREKLKEHLSNYKEVYIGISVVFIGVGIYLYYNDFFTYTIEIPPIPTTGINFTTHSIPSKDSNLLMFPLIIFPLYTTLLMKPFFYFIFGLDGMTGNFIYPLVSLGSLHSFSNGMDALEYFQSCTPIYLGMTLMEHQYFSYRALLTSIHSIRPMLSTDYSIIHWFSDIEELSTLLDTQRNIFLNKNTISRYSLNYYNSLSENTKLYLTLLETRFKEGFWSNLRYEYKHANRTITPEIVRRIVNDTLLDLIRFYEIPITQLSPEFVDSVAFHLLKALISSLHLPLDLNVEENFEKYIIYINVIYSVLGHANDLEFYRIYRLFKLLIDQGVLIGYF